MSCKCPICLTNKISFVQELVNADIQTKVYRCESCDLDFLDTWDNVEYVKSLYEGDKYIFTHNVGCDDKSNLKFNEYDKRYGINEDHLSKISEINFANAKKNPNSQTRGWSFESDTFSRLDHANPVIEGRTRKMDCGQVTDGAAIIFLASENKAKEYAKARSIDIASIIISFFFFTSKIVFLKFAESNI